MTRRFFIIAAIPLFALGEKVLRATELIAEAAGRPPTPYELYLRDLRERSHAMDREIIRLAA